MSYLAVISWWLLLLAVLTFVVWWLYRQPPEVQISHQVSTTAFQGGTIPLTVQTKLRSFLPVRYVVEHPTPRSVVPHLPINQVGELFGEHQDQTSTTLTLNKRGSFDWPAATLRWADPLGLFWRSRTLPQPTHLDVFPHTHGLVLPDILRPLLSEGGLSRKLGLEDPISLRNMRDYVSGDPPGRIQWRLTARSGTLTVRELERTAASSMTVYLDLCAGGEVYVESAVRLAASLIQEALELGLPVAVSTNEGTTLSGRHPEALQQALLRLAQVQARPGEAPSIPPSRAGGNLFVITYHPTPALIEQAMYARAHASRVVIIAIPEGFYLEPGEKPRQQWAASPDAIRDLERQAGALASAGILVHVLRGNQSILKLGA